MPTAAHLIDVLEGSRIEAIERGKSGDGWEISSPVQAVPTNGSFSEATADEVHLVERLFFLLGKEAPRVVVFCGTEGTDGSELVCARAAEVLASLVKDAICLIDADLRTPTLHLRYSIDDAYRMVDQRPKNETEKAKGIPWPNLWVLPTSRLNDARPGLSLDHVRDRLARLREKFGYLLICAPPLGTAPEGLLWGQMCDGVVVTLLANSTKRTTALKVRASLEKYNVRLLGVVLNEGRKGKDR
jgi:Mrp family chromosome partitioning ATPase